MSNDPLTDFQERYLQTWTEPDPERRRTAIDQVWAADGHLSVSSLGITLDGTDDIAAHITGVHDDLIADKGLRFRYDQHVQADDAVLLRWSMLAPSGEAVGRGVDLVFRGPQGRVRSVYMFMGVD